MLLDLDVRDIDYQRSRLLIGLRLKPRWFLALPFSILWPVMMRRRAQEVIDGTVASAKQLVESGQV